MLWWEWRLEAFGCQRGFSVSFSYNQMIFAGNGNSPLTQPFCPWGVYCSSRWFPKAYGMSIYYRNVPISTKLLWIFVYWATMLHEMITATDELLADKIIGPKAVKYAAWSQSFSCKDWRSGMKAAQSPIVDGLGIELWLAIARQSRFGRNFQIFCSKALRLFPSEHVSWKINPFSLNPRFQASSEHYRETVNSP